MIMNLIEKLITKILFGDIVIWDPIKIDEKDIKEDLDFKGGVNTDRYNRRD